MLGWYPPPSVRNRPSSGSSYLPQGHEIVHLSTFHDEKAVLEPPHQVVIGFDLGVADSSKSLHAQACVSPRSVLDPYCPQSSSPRSPLSALGSLLADRGCAGRNSIEATEIAADVRAYQKVLMSEHAARGAGRVGTCNTSDSFAFSKHTRERAFKHQARERQSLFREAHRIYGRSNKILSSDDGDDHDYSDVGNSKSIFTASSPLSHSAMFNDQTGDFLSKCFWCRRRLVEGKDIYMYRGDLAFCSQECRYEKVVDDERDHSGPAVAPYFSRVTSDHRSVARATQAVIG